MNEEKVVRKEAKEFYERKIKGTDNYNAIEDFHLIKIRLNDFYTINNKAIFLDEIELIIENDLQKHRDNSHGGKAKEGCHIEETAEKLLFYLKQELNTLPVIAHQKFKSEEENIRENVFISYSHIDDKYLKDIKRHFKPFLKKINFWDDTNIQPGQEWKKEIEKAISKTKVAILLISTDFLGSEFITTEEIPPLLNAAEENGAVILTVILKPCLFEEFNDLNKYQAMNPPSKPISKMNENEKEELFVNLVRQTKKILDKQL
ncbi:toll/interleukin-1 receptor domain-containing protein [Tenacibaculum finnmarkense]|uniref:toll/interleukin-1 receptor domain-containing protein n=1 Tax=Tenacibaculum finnmarkense TaxID=2781243 RepID=UPI001E3FC293|nr:toll/interleukin-1 receptor domain-containing protein [Tenacibaculum finnmarkense]MCD8401279.1 toll/interleukin-1 receptor domain-containing protein [Tenacibaculum finnmarkense genomovar ulcerans]MCG8786423.1 toll/interleukin-1 receptor domain-containing protein [Tenacibaculum finnmarkense]MCG8795342.1 toll/interleukin-1 receptor domain-containing protein [Tenacibaculum finnmarkense]MCG8798943.1 toll/interleukin-1 receptor domain-containing protein [Tenacibaculum finnmarkense]MCG8813998.1 t